MKKQPFGHCLVLALFLSLIFSLVAGCESFEEKNRRRMGFDKKGRQEKAAQKVASAEKEEQLMVRETPVEEEREEPSAQDKIVANLEEDPYDGDSLLSGGNSTQGMEKMMEGDGPDVNLPFEAGDGTYGQDNLDIKLTNADGSDGESPLTSDNPLSADDSYLKKGKANIDEEPKPLGVGPTAGYLDGLAKQTAEDVKLRGKKGAAQDAKGAFVAEPGGSQTDQIAAMANGTADGKPGKARNNRRRRKSTRQLAAERKQRIATKRNSTKRSRLRASTSVPEIRLTSGVTIPQSLPTGTAVGFAIQYEFTKGRPTPGATYVWMLRSSKGKTMGRRVPLRGSGTLKSIVPEFRPQDAPFQAVILEVRSGGLKRQVARPYTFPTKIPQ